MIKLKKILNEKESILVEKNDVAGARKRINKTLKDVIKKEQEYIMALGELRTASNHYYSVDQLGPNKDIAIAIGTSLRNGALYTAERNRIGGNNARYREIRDLISKL